MKLDLRRCARCGKIPRGKLKVAEAAKYAPYCSFHCQEMNKVLPLPDARYDKATGALPPQVAEQYYRFEEQRYAAPVDEFDNPVGRGELKVELRRFNVIRKTPKGVWIDVYGTPRFVLSDALKHYALPDVEQAQASFIARKRKQVRIYQARINDAKEALRQTAAATPSPSVALSEAEGVAIDAAIIGALTGPFARFVKPTIGERKAFIAGRKSASHRPKTEADEVMESRHETRGTCEPDPRDG